MNTGIKFTFDKVFDLRGAAAGEDLDSRARTHTEEALVAAREEAFAQGLAAGLERARGETARAIADALAQMNRRLEDLQTADRERRRQAVNLALAIGAKLAGTLMRRQPLAEAEALIRDCLAEVAEEPRVVIRVNEALLDDLKHRLGELAAECGFGGEIVILGDDALEGSDCRVEWADGGSERVAADVERQIAAAIERAFGDHDHGPDAPATPVPMGETAAESAPGETAEAPGLTQPEATAPTVEVSGDAGDEHGRR